MKLIILLIFFFTITASGFSQDKGQSISLVTYYPTPYGEFDNIFTQSFENLNVISNIPNNNPANISDFRFVNFNKGIRIFGAPGGSYNGSIAEDLNTINTNTNTYNFIDIRGDAPYVMIANQYIRSGIELEPGAVPAKGIVNMGINTITKKNTSDIEIWTSVDTINNKFSWNYDDGTFNNLMNLEFESPDKGNLSVNKGDIVISLDAIAGENVLVKEKLGIGVTNPTGSDKLFIKAGSPTDKTTGILFRVNDTNIAKIKTGWHDSYPADFRNLRYSINMPYNGSQTNWKDMITVRGNKKVGFGTNDPQELLELNSIDPNIDNISLTFRSGMQTSGSSTRTDSMRFTSGWHDTASINFGDQKMSVYANTSNGWNDIASLYASGKIAADAVEIANNNAIQIGDNLFISSGSSNNVNIGYNCYYNGSSWQYQNSNNAKLIQISSKKLFTYQNINTDRAWQKTMEIRDNGDVWINKLDVENIAIRNIYTTKGEGKPFAKYRHYRNDDNNNYIINNTSSAYPTSSWIAVVSDFAARYGWLNTTRTYYPMDHYAYVSGNIFNISCWMDFYTNYCASWQSNIIFISKDYAQYG